MPSAPRRGRKRRRPPASGAASFRDRRGPGSFKTRPRRISQPDAAMRQGGDAFAAFRTFSRRKCSEGCGIACRTWPERGSEVTGRPSGKNYGKCFPVLFRSLPAADLPCAGVGFGCAWPQRSCHERFVPREDRFHRKTPRQESVCPESTNKLLGIQA